MCCCRVCLFLPLCVLIVCLLKMCLVAVFVSYCVVMCDVVGSVSLCLCAVVCDLLLSVLIVFECCL